MKKRFLPYLALVIVIILLWFTLRPVLPSKGVPPYRALAMQDSRSVAIALRAYWQDTSKMPVVLYDLPQNYLGNKERSFQNYETGQLYDWLYFAEEYSGGSMTEYIVVASPMTFDGDRVVAFLDGHVEAMDETDFRKAIKQQKAQANATSPTSTGP